MTHLKPYDQHEDERLQFYAERDSGLTGIACPKCEVSELIKLDPHVIVMSDPPQSRVRCSNEDCNFTGYITV